MNEEIKNEDIEISIDDSKYNSIAELNPHEQIKHEESIEKLDGSSSDLEQDPRDCMLPDGKQIQLTLQYMDIAVVLEKMLFDMHGLFYWVSASEVVAFFFGLVCWAKLHDRMWLVLLFFPHLIRGIVGFKISQKFPTSQQIVADIDFGGGDYEQEQQALAAGKVNKNITFDKVTEQLRTSGTKIFGKIYYDNKVLMHIYGFATGFSTFFDAVLLCIILYRYGNPGEEDAEMILLLLWVANVLLSSQWMIFGVHLRHRLPEHIGDVLMDGAFAVGKDATIDAMKWRETKENQVKMNFLKTKRPVTM